jgi:hypothetical protein
VDLKLPVIISDPDPTLKKCLDPDPTLSTLIFTLSPEVFLKCNKNLPEKMTFMLVEKPVVNSGVVSDL